MRARGGSGRHLPGRDAPRGRLRQRRRDDARGHAPRSPVAITAGFVIDASGPRGFLTYAHSGRAARPCGGCRRRRDSSRTSKASSAGTTSRRPAGTPPYPPDDAALHHVFPGGWIWVLRFNNGITSAGAALTDPARRNDSRRREGAPAWERLLARSLRSREQFRRHAPCCRSSTRRAWRSGAAQSSASNGRSLPSAAGVIDPLLSTGFPFTLARHRAVARCCWRTRRLEPKRDAALADVRETRLRHELDATEQLVAALYAMHDRPRRCSSD